MKQKLKRVLAIFLAAALILVSATCDSADEPATRQKALPKKAEPIAAAEPQGPLSRTFMIYIVGSDLESYYAAATYDIVEMLESGVDLSWNNVLIQTGGANRWYENMIPNDRTMIYELSDDDIIDVLEQPARNMGDPRTLTDFLTYCYDNYTSDAYSLILWNHGAGPMGGFGHDERTHDILHLEEIYAALDNSPFSRDNKLEFVGFDACLMNTVEIAFVLGDYAEYMIASQETEPGWGWDYSFLGNIIPEMTGEEIAVEIIDSYYAYSEMVFEVRPDLKTDITLSCLNLSALPEIERCLDALYINAGNSLDASSFPSAARSRNTAKEFGRFTTSTSYDLVDIWHLNSLMEEGYYSEARELSNAMERFVVYNRSNVGNANGVSIYYPYRNLNLVNRMGELYDSFGFADGYADYIDRFVRLLRGDKLADWNMSRSDAAQDSDSRFFVQLTPEQAATYASASFYILQKIDTGDEYDGYYFLFRGTDVELDGSGRLYANYEGQTQMILDTETGETAHCIMLEQERTDEYVRYYIPVILNDYDPARDPELMIEAGLLQLQIDADGNNARILSVVPILDELFEEFLIAPRQLLDVYEFSTAFFAYIGSLLTYNDDGSVKPLLEWNLTGTAFYTEINLNRETRDSIHFVQSDFDLDQEYFELSDGTRVPVGGYYLVFNITDVQGNVVSSNLIPMTRG